MLKNNDVLFELYTSLWYLLFMQIWLKTSLCPEDDYPYSNENLMRIIVIKMNENYKQTQAYSITVL